MPSILNYTILDDTEITRFTCIRKYERSAQCKCGVFSNMFQLSISTKPKLTIT